MTAFEPPTRLIADVNEAAALCCASGRPDLAKAVLQARDLSASKDEIIHALTQLVEAQALQETP